VVQAELFGDIAAGIVEDGISVSHQTTQDFLAFSLFQVQADALLVPVEGLEELTIIFSKEIGTDMAPHIPIGARVFHLDDLRAQVGQVLGCERACPVLLNRYDANIFQGTSHFGFLSISCFAIMMRCNSLVPSPMAMRGASR